MTALVGPSGGGKSTAAKLAARFWDADDGVVSIGGVDVSTVDPEALLVDFAPSVPGCGSVRRHDHAEHPTR